MANMMHIFLACLMLYVSPPCSLAETTHSSVETDRSLHVSTYPSVKKITSDDLPEDYHAATISNTFQDIPPSTISATSPTVQPYGDDDKSKMADTHVVNKTGGGARREEKKVQEFSRGLGDWVGRASRGEWTKNTEAVASSSPPHASYVQNNFVNGDDSGGSAGTTSPASDNIKLVEESPARNTIPHQEMFGQTDWVPIVSDKINGPERRPVSGYVFPFSDRTTTTTTTTTYTTDADGLFFSSTAVGSELFGLRTSAAHPSEKQFVPMQSTRLEPDYLHLVTKSDNNIIQPRTTPPPADSTKLYSKYRGSIKYRVPPETTALTTHKEMELPPTGASWALATLGAPSRTKPTNLTFLSASNSSSSEDPNTLQLNSSQVQEQNASQELKELLRNTIPDTASLAPPLSAVTSEAKKQVTSEAKKQVNQRLNEENSAVTDLSEDIGTRMSLVEELSETNTSAMPSIVESAYLDSADTTTEPPVTAQTQSPSFSSATTTTVPPITAQTQSPSFSSATTITVPAISAQTQSPSFSPATTTTVPAITAQTQSPSFSPATTTTELPITAQTQSPSFSPAAITAQTQSPSFSPATTTTVPAITAQTQSPSFSPATTTTEPPITAQTQSPSFSPATTTIKIQPQAPSVSTTTSTEQPTTFTQTQPSVSASIDSFEEKFGLKHSVQTQSPEQTTTSKDKSQVSIALGVDEGSAWTRWPLDLEETTHMTTTQGNTISPEEELAESDVPAYLRLTVLSSTSELCSLRQQLRSAITKILSNGSHRNVTIDNVVLLHPSDSTCALQQHSASTESLLPVNMFLRNSDGDFDRNLTEAFLSLWARHGLDFVLAIRKVDFVSPVVQGAAGSDDSMTVSVVVAIVISCIAGLCLILLGILFVVMKRRQKRFNYGQRCTPVSLDAYSLDSVSMHNSVRRKGVRASKRSYGNAAFDDPDIPSHPMNFAGLANFSSDKDQLFEEFAVIPQVSPKPDELPPGVDVKNRYANVMPLPETRVVLSARQSEPLSEYINANYVRGCKGVEKLYIACQAPLDSTVQDFWRMVWEQQVRVVMMLTALQENGVEKCADYMPPSEVTDNTRLFGDYQITLTKRHVKEKYMISTLQIKNMESNLWREVTHLWYLGWPDQGVPNDPHSLIAFLIEARSQMKTAPAVVHCSPGTGRTGTVIACDLCIRDFEQSRLVDIPRVVFRLRKDRAGAVQTKEQYAFIYQVLNVYATKLTGGGLESI